MPNLVQIGGIKSSGGLHLRTILVACLAAGLIHCAPIAVAQANSVSLPTRGTASESSVLAKTSRDADRSTLQQKYPRYRLCTSDVITLTFVRTPEFDQTLTIQPDGSATLAGAGDVHLEGLSTQEAVQAVQKAYGKILRDPLITIELKDFNKPYFVVAGQVQKPGKYDLRGNTFATEAIATAGGFNDSAKHSQVLLFRRIEDNWYEVKSLDLKRILCGHNVGEDVEMRSGDMLYVPQSFISKVRKLIPSTGVGTYYQLHN